MVEKDNQKNAEATSSNESEGPFFSVEMFVYSASRYDRGYLDRWGECHCSTWRGLTEMAKQGVFDIEYFIDMADWTFEKHIAEANNETVSRGVAYTAVHMKEYADLDVDISPEFAASQLVAEAISMQSCIGWQAVDGEIRKDKLVVIDEDENRFVLDILPLRMEPLVEHIKAKRAQAG